MAVEVLRIRNLRNLEEIEMEPGPQRSLLYGDNGAGKTSVLEGIFLLGRGRTFRRGRQGQIVGGWGREAVVSGTVEVGGVRHRMGMQRGRDGATRGTIDGRSVRRSAELAELLPVRVIGPDCQQLVEGGGGIRQRYLDWGVFHVKPMAREAYQRFRRALEQRNAALRARLPSKACQAWDQELVAAAVEVGAAREAHIGEIAQAFNEMRDFQGHLPPIALEYRPGWDPDRGLGAHLEANLSADREAGTTAVGPQRADLRLSAEGRAAQTFLSRGQQKTLAVALLLAQVIVVDRALERRLALLVDDLPSELDGARLEASVGVLEGVRAQLLATALDRALLPKRIFDRVFHVKQGQVIQVV